ncbi:hypothetical protein BMS3Bbin12_00398 [bacterium BMS3Bbin12]|nr:hypothetical protein BMS3Bbin12_00398 [bacterium BMS3Bbin12]GBE50634.1 hypothetical protein BMS3Bbin13_01574 [bacterium BMS3Bbin13]
MLEKNSLEFGLAISQGGFPRTAWKPALGPWNTSGNSISQWKKRFVRANSSVTARVSSEGLAKLAGSGAQSSRSAGQNQQAHQRSKAAFNSRQDAEPSRRSR